MRRTPDGETRSGGGGSSRTIAAEAESITKRVELKEHAKNAQYEARLEKKKGEIAIEKLHERILKLKSLPPCPYQHKRGAIGIVIYR